MRRGLAVYRVVWSSWRGAPGRQPGNFSFAASTFVASSSPRLLTFENNSFCPIWSRAVTTGTMSSDDEDFAPAAVKKAAVKVPSAKKPAKQPKDVGAMYEKLEQLEHVLKRPDTYIGSVQKVTEKMWVFDAVEKKLVYRTITFVPGLYKIFDEILVNAADNKQRDQEDGRADKVMTEIKINIDPEANKISVWNNGRAIPIQIHPKEKIYVPTLIFGHLLAGSNFNDDEKKTTGGRNGYGAKLCNAFSTKFTLSVASKDDGKTFKQTWTDNMNKVEKEIIKENSRNEDFTMVEFWPDLKRFDMEKLDDDFVALLSRRAYDLAGTVRGVKIRLNGDIIPLKTFEEYVKMYTCDSKDDLGNPVNVVVEKIGKEGITTEGTRWEVAVCSSTEGQFQQVSFANRIATTKGGRHVDYVTEQIAKVLGEQLKKKNKTGQEIKPAVIKQNLWVFVNCLVENPTFDSQTKEALTLQASKFGSKFQISDDFSKKVLKMGVWENILQFQINKQKTKLDRAGGTKTSKLKNIPKLEDANDAGTKHSDKCTLILTEGDSAKALVVSGFSVVGRDKYGVFPLRGKLLNVRDATPKQLLENAEIQNIVKILGLKFNCKYQDEEDFKRLRYGRLMIMTDQDQDGSHIKGLLINFIHHSWPHLLKRTFLEQFITPIVKANKKGQDTLSFYSLPEFEEWKAATADWPKWQVKYFKGLGTSTSKEAKEYFQDMNRHQINFKWGGPEDDVNIDMAFSKTKADDRKKWLTEGMEERKTRRAAGEKEIYLYEKKTKNVSYSEFVNKELILFSNADNERSIPSIVDGLKPGQRKVIYTCFLRNDRKEVKVAQLAGSVAEKSAYHHGEVSLQSTIVGLAQDYVGSNNINLLLPCGQFGTRLQGGKDSASPRYIFTMLSPLARAIFTPRDMPLLEYQREEGRKIEPEWYMPVVPMVLVNGSKGIGTGWSTDIPNYNPRDIVDNIRRMMRDEPQKHMSPWFKGHRGEMKEIDDGSRIVSSGEVAILDDDTVEITELPVRVWTQTYKETVIEPMALGVEAKEKKKAVPPQIMDYREYHTDTTVRFTVKLDKTKMKEFEKEGFHKVFKLQTTLSLSNLVLFDSNGVIKTYTSVGQIMEEFYKLRLDFYEKQKVYWIAKLGAEAKRLQNQARFIEEKIEGKIKVENVKRVDIIKLLKDRKYDSDPVEAWKKGLGEAAFVEDEEPATNEDDVIDKVIEKEKGPNYDYLMGMSFWKLSNEQKIKLLEERDNKEAELADLTRKTPKDLWNADLDFFLEKLDEAAIADRDAQGIQGGAAVKPLKGVKGTGRGGKAAPPSKKDTLPSETGIRIEPIIDAAMVAKVERARNEKERKKKGEPSTKGRKKKEEVGENGELLSPSEKPKKPMKKEENGDEEGKSKMKQTTLEGFKKKGKKKAGSSDEDSDGFDSEALSDDSEIVVSDGSDEYDFDRSTEKMPVKKNRPVVVSAASAPTDADDFDRSTEKMPAKKNHPVVVSTASAPTDDDDIVEIVQTKGPVVAKSKSAVIEPDKAPESKSNGTKKATAASSNGSSTPVKKVRLASSSDDDSEVGTKKPPVKKAPAKVSRKAASDSDEDDYYDAKKPTKPKASKKADSEEFQPAVKKAAPAKESKKAAEKPAAVKKAAPVKRKAAISDSDDDNAPGTSSSSPIDKKKKSEGSKKAALDDSDEDIPVARSRPGRAAAVAASRKVMADSSMENLESDNESDYLETIE